MAAPSPQAYKIHGHSGGRDGVDEISLDDFDFDFDDDFDEEFEDEWQAVGAVEPDIPLPPQTT